jgi:transcriptional regulator with XRE-family HTH domain
LTSYINRLGWRCGVAPRALAAQEIGPLLEAERWNYPSPQLMGIFCATNAMSLNGPGNLTTNWAIVLEQLTKRIDIHLLTSPWWIGDLPMARNLRSSPAWCPTCYAEWKKQGLPIYQPLLWVLQVVTACSTHNRRLVERCPSCQGKQAVIASHKALPGECTKCAIWLGTEAEPVTEPDVDNEMMKWQLWVVQTLEELRMIRLSSEVIRWDAFFANLAVGMERPGSYPRLAQLTGINAETLRVWVKGTSVPSIEMILKFCYICGTTPLQIMDGQLSCLEKAIQDETVSHSFRHQCSPRQRIDREHCLKLLQAILDGRAEPLSIRQLAKRLGCRARALTDHFPQECALVTKLAREHRKQQQELRLEQVRNQVKQTVIAFHAQGISPSHRRLRAMLPPGVMRLPGADAAWHEARRDLGLEQ